MTWQESIFLVVLVINLVLAVIYLLFGLIFAPEVNGKREEDGESPIYDGKGTYLLRFFIMILCPVVGFIFYFAALLLYKTNYRPTMNLDDVTFSKDCVDSQVRANEEQERNIIPIEEALAVNDKKSLRAAMLGIIRGETDGTLFAISLALDSEDSEASHYAASVLSDKLNEFRMNVRKLYSEIWGIEEDAERIACGEKLIDYMRGVLKQKVFIQLEQSSYVRMMAEVADLLYEKEASRLTPEQYESVCLRLMEIEDFMASEQWCRRFMEQYPDALRSYTCMLKLYFETRNREAFFYTLDSLKKSDVVIDSETLELIRVFS